MNTQTETFENRAKSYAVIMSKDVELQADFETATTAKEITRRGAWVILNDLRRVFKDKLDGMPVPDSEGGNNPDLYPIDGSKKKGSFYNDLWKFYSIGAALEEVLRQCSLAKDAKTMHQAEQKYQDMDNIELDHLVDKTKKQRTYQRQVLKNAMGLHFQLKALEELPGVTITIKKNADGSLVDAGAAFLVRNSDTVNFPDRLKHCNVDTILKFNVAKAKENGGTYDALLATLKKGKPENKPNSVPQLTRETVTPHLERVYQQMAGATETDEKEADFLKFLLSENGTDMLLYLGRMEKLTASIFNRKEVKIAYAKAEAELEQDTGTQSEAEAA